MQFQGTTSNNKVALWKVT